MTLKHHIPMRSVVIILVAVATLAALVVASGNNTPPSSPSAPTSAPPPAATSPPTQRVRGSVMVGTRHLTGRTWSFTYTVRNTGSFPIAGFELNSPAPSNLFHLRSSIGWSYYGSGVCHQTHDGVLIYWSTGAGSPTRLAPGRVARFSFQVNTSGPTSLQYSLSWGAAAPSFGNVKGPAPSSLPTSGACSR